MGVQFIVDYREVDAASRLNEKGEEAVRVLVSLVESMAPSEINSVSQMIQSVHQACREVIASCPDHRPAILIGAASLAGTPSVDSVKQSRNNSFLSLYYNIPHGTTGSIDTINAEPIPIPEGY